MTHSEKPLTIAPHAIVVFGEALIDDFGHLQVAGGAPFNVARHLAAFGAAPLLITRVGNDANGDLIQAQFARFALSVAGLQRDQVKPTGRVVVEHGAEGHRFLIEPDQAYDQIDSATALAALCATAPPPALTSIYFGTLAQRNAVSRGALHQVLAASSAQRYLDLNVREGQVTERAVYDSLLQADIVKVNEEELHDLFRLYHHVRLSSADMESKEVRAACAVLLRVFKLRALVVTLGSRGAVCFESGGAMCCALDVVPVTQLVDTVGAGDAFSAIFLLGDALRWPMAITLERANAFAGAICTVPGAVPAQRTFYDRWINSWFPV